MHGLDETSCAGRCSSLPENQTDGAKTAFQMSTTNHIKEPQEQD